jgi:hypothetical protein
MNMQLLTYWLTRESTLITVVGPLAACAAGAAWLAVNKARRAVALGMTLKLLLVALLCTPLAHLTSFWSKEGLHIVPVSLVPFLYLVCTKQLDLRTHWLAVFCASWLDCVVPDVAGAWAAFAPTPTWYWGVGGVGFNDALFVGPLVSVAALFAVQSISERSYLVLLAPFIRSSAHTSSLPARLN